MSHSRDIQKTVSPRTRERGQVSILFALIFTFMLVLFAFVVDFGHLINTKINLQLAADAAAYSGAAWQARTLNSMAAVNYRIRQDLKELAMRVQVTHLRHNRNYPRGTSYINGTAQAPQVEPFICQQAQGYRSLSGLRYADDTNLCRNASPTTGGLPPIVVPPVIADFDPFAKAITAQIRKIADAANQQCRAAANDNQKLANHLVQVFTNRSVFHSKQLTALADWLNSTGSGKIDENAKHPIAQTVYQTVRRNLSLAARDDLKVEILGPAGGEYVRLEQTKLKGSLFYVDFNVVGDGCVGRPKFLDFDGMVAGVRKTPEILTFFAVKLSASPKLMFMPQAWLDAAFPTLEAFSAAKPFGGRIGPQPQNDPLMPIPDRPGNQNRMINFSFKPGDRLGIMNTKLMALFDALHPFNNVPRSQGDQKLGWPDPDSTNKARDPLALIQAPTIFDAMFYTVFPNINRGQDYIEPQFAEGLFPDFLEGSDFNNNVLETSIKPSTAAYFPTSVGSKNLGQGYIQVNAGADTAPGGSPYGDYAHELPSSHSNQIAVGMPFINDDGKAKEFGFATKDMVHSGWAPEDGKGRIGYSVKFIGFDALMGKLIVNLSNGGRGAIANKPTNGGGRDDDNLQKTIH